MRENGKYKKKFGGKKIFARSAVICILAVIVCSSVILGLAAQDTGATVNVTANAPEYVLGTFNASIAIDSITGFNSGQFDLSFDSSVVNVTGVANGSLDSETIQVDNWEFVDSNTIRVFLDVSGVAGVNGSGNLVTISFAVLGLGGDRSVLSVSDGLLKDIESKEILAVWVDDEVIVGPVGVEVNAPELVDAGGSFTATIDVLDDVANFNMAVFNLSFDSSVVKVTNVTEGSLDGTAVPIASWDLIDSNTIKVMSELSGVTGVNGSGNLATINFAVLGIGGDRSVLEISDAMLANNKAREIPTTLVNVAVIVGPVKVAVNASELVDAGGSFTATIDVVEDVANFNMALFDLSFDSSVVNVTDVTAGSLDGTAVPITSWELVDSGTIKIMCELSGVTGVNGSGNLATINFAVLGIDGDRSVLEISDAMLANNKAEEIPTTLVNDEVIVGPVKVAVNAPELVDVGGSFTAAIDVLEDVANFNMALFDLSFDSSVVNVTDVTAGSLDGTAVPITTWEFIDSDTIKVMCELSGVTGVNGSGNLATISFDVVGKSGDKSVLELSNGMLANNEADEIPAEWVADEVTLS
ncbi:Cohesin domain-containing protein [Methanophagales archaeon]|nr:Cohesin domain-containing protein [Methanophagales archaeon]